MVAALWVKPFPLYDRPLRGASRLMFLAAWFAVSCSIAVSIATPVMSDEAAPVTSATPSQQAVPAPAAQPAGPAQPDPVPKNAPVETPATVIDGQQVESLLGKPVESSTGEDMGQIVDVLADKTGQPRAAIIDFGGFFGVGSRKIAVDWRSLHFIADAKADKIVVGLPKNQLKLAPLYKEGEPVVVLGPGVPAASGAQAGAAPAPPSPPPPAPSSPATPAPPQTP